MMKKTLLLLSITYMNYAADFLSSTDTAWKYQLSSYSELGGILDADKAVPEYTVGQSVLDTMINSLPEGQRADTAHPEYFPSPEPEIIVTENAEVFVTFYSEGAGYKNALGFYTYDGDTNRSRPESTQEIQNNGKILFPNTSLLDSGGDLTLGTSVSLGELSSGTKVIFFLVSNGWQGPSTGVISSNDWIFSSFSPLNLEYDPNSAKEVPDHKHTALLWQNVGPGNILLMGFEDILRTHNTCDHDFNDVLFSVSSSPMAALKDTIEVATGTSGFSVAPEEKDTDSDGVNDAFDAFPEDASRTYISYYPSNAGKATLLFEDMWPIKGDYDMNDLAIDFSIQEVKDNQQQVKDIIFSGSIQSYGANYTNGFALLIDTPLSNISTAQMSRNGGEKYDISSTIRADGNSTVIKLFDDAEEYLAPYANAYKETTFVQSDTFELFITLKSAATLSAPPYNPFMIVSRYLPDNNDSYIFMDNIEVHLPNHAPSSSAPSSLFSTLDDSTDTSTGRTYLTGDDKPWALLIPSVFAHPVSGINIEDAYHHYLEWVYSAGSTYKDWYIHNKSDGQNQPYSDESKIIIRP